MSVSAAASVRRIALIGNPNTGKTTLFNALTGLAQRVGNYPGVTVEKKIGKLEPGLEVIDLPGTYSLAAHSPDERVAVDVLLGAQAGEPRPDLVVVIADAGNLERNLYLVTQVMETGLPVVVALNMMDVARENGIAVDPAGLESALGVPIVPMVAARREGLDELRAAVKRRLGSPAPKTGWTWPPPLAKELEALRHACQEEDCLLLRALVDEGGAAEEALAGRHGAGVRERLRGARARIREAGKPAAAFEAQTRYAWIGQAVRPHVSRRDAGVSFTDRADALLTHRVFGSAVFAVLMTGVFMVIFRCAGPFMDFIDAMFGTLQEGVTGLLAGTALEGGAFESLLVDGVIAGVGGVLIFLPQICFLFLFIALLEDCGYMARAAFLMDRLLRFCGLSGHSFIPMMSSFACAVPGVMSARTIANPRDRLATILVAPLMSCSARLPVYSLLVAAFVSDAVVAGFLPLRGLVFAAMYFLGIVVAVAVAFLLKRTLLKGPTPPFVMELPPYRRPSPRNVSLRVWEAAKAFTVRAGTIILAISIVIWALNYFPRSDEIAESYAILREAAEAEGLDEDALAARLEDLERLEAGAYQRDSYFGRMGHFIEPLVRPLGWDWRIGMAALASFPAREVVVATLGIIYDLGGEVDVEDDTSRARMVERLQAVAWPDGRPVFNLPVALSIMVFFALCCQCGATVATIKRETNSWKWALFAFAYMTVLAYVGALAAYQIGIRV
ncbi:MAG: ferrous iron transport protein B [Planctomycetota bacterium]|nr:ferrous iron transport protein B [Planctomycetota bacterium]